MPGNAPPPSLHAPANQRPHHQKASGRPDCDGPKRTPLSDQGSSHLPGVHADYRTRDPEWWLGAGGITVQITLGCVHTDVNGETRESRQDEHPALSLPLRQERALQTPSTAHPPPSVQLRGIWYQDISCIFPSFVLPTRRAISLLTSQTGQLMKLGPQVTTSIRSIDVFAHQFFTLTSTPPWSGERRSQGQRSHISPSQSRHREPVGQTSQSRIPQFLVHAPLKTTNTGTKMDESHVGRRARTSSTRPESSSSSNTRMTPQTSSNNSSSAHLPRSNLNTSAGASLLQERLRERKVESARLQRRGSVDTTSNGARDAQSSPVTANHNHTREERRPSSSGVGAAPSKKGMGVKQMEEQVSTLHKQNFDLKLELYHRRKRQDVLEAKLEAAEKQIADQGELQEVNEQLLTELEKRDQAVEEAVGIICGLEEKVEKLMREREAVRSIDEQFDSNYLAAAREDGPPSSPPTSDENRSKAVVRMPSFLSEQSEGAEALRSLYLPSSVQGHSEATLPKLVEESGTSDGMNSPRLSVLSESSFLSVYGEKSSLQEDVDCDLPSRRRSLSVERWIDERHASPSSITKPLQGSSSGSRRNHYLSINDVLESPLQRLEKLRHKLEKVHSAASEVQQPAKDKGKGREGLHHVITNQPAYRHHQHTLPPTPDTISTGTLRHFHHHHHHSTETLGPDRPLDNAGTFLQSASTLSGKDAYPDNIPVRPRSAGETVTSRREGHGWDTQTEMTDDTNSTTTSTFENAAMYGPRRIKEPNLFTFGVSDDQDDEADWGRDMMFNHNSHLPVNTAPRYKHIRRLSMAEHPHSDDTVIPYERYDEPVSTSPAAPVRRSSLSATSRLRKVPPNPPPITTSSPTKNSETPPATKRYRLTNLFNRSETSPVLPPSRQRHTRTDTPDYKRSQSYMSSNNHDSMSSPAKDEIFRDVGYGSDYARATPPPIARSRTVAPGQMRRLRPSSAGGERKFGGEVEVRVDVEEVEDKDEKNSSASNAGPSGSRRSWFGIPRAATLRR
ncbi:hypothetical protein B7494_g5372 [Chlorociboria aeruginascens]|nr:hypothetical protein B7494_g5372 [Chlorociboria aeruginascens]